MDPNAVSADTFSIVTLFMSADWVIKLVMIGLALASLWSWAVIIDKGFRFTSLNASAESSRVAYQIEIGETTANANVVMNLGDTLVLSGLSERSSSSTRDGVPGLQEVPGLQYLFSNKKTNDIQRSVLILVTPRSPVQIAEAGAGANDSMASRMQALRQRFGFGDNNPANVEAVLTQLQANEFFREFRQGDVSMERWDRARTTGERLREALGFLYY